MHVLLTRSPLSHQSPHTEAIGERCFVRLACLRHAASVHPEPGSNSPKRCQIVVLADLACGESTGIVLVSATGFSRTSRPGARIPSMPDGVGACQAPGYEDPGSRSPGAGRYPATAAGRAATACAARANGGTRHAR